MHLVFNNNSELISDLFGLGAHYEQSITPSNQILVVRSVESVKICISISENVSRMWNLRAGQG